MSQELVIGLEIHLKIASPNKLFCRCKNEQEFGSLVPNTNICPVCTAQPGALPVLTKEPLVQALILGKALGCTWNNPSSFDRKMYFYPDLPAGYQITQYYCPTNVAGQVSFFLDAAYTEERTVGIRDAHIETDTGKTIHVGGQALLDFNRAGTPLVEIVTDPDFRSADEVVAFLKELQRIARYNAISDADMDKGQMRVDVNISIRPQGELAYGTRTELKNINSFSAIKRAIEHEYARQVALFGAGEVVAQQTRGRDDMKNTSFCMRSKENALDYRYFPEPDLPPLVLDAALLAEVGQKNVEIPHQIIKKMKTDWGFHKEYINALIADKDVLTYFMQFDFDKKLVAKWMTGPIAAWAKEQYKNIYDLPFSADVFSSFLRLAAEKKLQESQLKIIMDEMLATGKDATTVAKEKGFSAQESVGGDVLVSVIAEILAENQAIVEQYKEGKTTTMGFFVGQVMRKTAGKANPKDIEAKIIEMLG